MKITPPALHAATLSLIIVCGTAFGWPIDSVFARADSCIGIVWTPTATNTNPAWYQQWGSLCTGSDSVYRHCDFAPSRSYSSIAYSYGGEDPYATFRSKIAAGAHPGSHLCHYKSFGDPSAVIAGTDCTGFLCWIWNEPRQNTGGMVASTKYSHPARSALAPGDALIKAGSHAVLIVDPEDPALTLIVESTSDGNCVRTRKIDVNASYWMAYTPVRNPAITQGASAIFELAMGHNAPGVLLTNQHLTIPALSGFSQILLCDTRGVVVIQEELSASSTHIDMRGRAAGIYLARLSSPTGTVTLRIPFTP